MASSYSLYTGNCPRSVNKDSKYVIRSLRSVPVVTVTYICPNGERWLATTEGHPCLVRIVNDIKIGAGGIPNGPFYINEYGQVVVPVGQDATYYVSNEVYDLPLRFEFEGNLISGQGIDLQGRPIEVGSLWSGPHPGIPYVLEPGMRDIRYDSNPRPQVTKRVRLSAQVGAGAAAEMALRIGNVKGWGGGRFYINEWKEFFAPLTVNEGLEYRYIGHLEEDDPWFPKPSP